MAWYAKNDTNNQGARSKSSRTDRFYSKNNDGWDSVPAGSGNNNSKSNWDDGWDTTPDFVQRNSAWGQDRVSGRSDRNRKAHSNNDNSSSRVSPQIHGNQNGFHDDFPSIDTPPDAGGRVRFVSNVWERRKRAFEEKSAIQPSSITEEERMIQHAIEISKMEIRQEEERRRQLEEEYRIQSQMLEANPDMFNEFRFDKEEVTSNNNMHQSSRNDNGHSEVTSYDEEADHGAWGYSSTKATHSKGKTKSDYVKMDHNPKRNSHSEKQYKNVEYDGNWDSPDTEDHEKKKSHFPKDTSPSEHGARPKRNSCTEKQHQKVEYDGNWDSPSTEDYTKEKGISPFPKVVDSYSKPKQDHPLPTVNSNSVTQIQISKTVKLFGGWGKPKPSANQDAKSEKPSNKLKSNQWETVETNFVPKPSNKAIVEEKPPTKPFSSTNLEVKLENTSNWDVGEINSDSAAAESDWDDVSSASATKESNWEAFEAPPSLMPSESQNYLGTRDAVELNLKDCEPGYRLDQKEKEFATQSKNKKSKIKADPSIDFKQNSPVPEEPSLSESCDRLSTVKSNKSSAQPESVADNRNAGAKSKVNLLKEASLDPHVSAESDYTFLLSNMSNTHSGSQSEYTDPKPISHAGGREDIFSNKVLATDMPSTTDPLDYFLHDPSPGEPSIPHPKLLENKTQISSKAHFTLENNKQSNSIEANPMHSFKASSYDSFQALDNSQDMPTFGGYPTKFENPTFPNINEMTLKEQSAMPSSNEFLPHTASPALTQINNVINNIGQPQPTVPNPAFFFQPSPMMSPLMNPALMMGMNPMMMQQMMMLSNPFFVQQLHQMDMYYKSMGMSLPTGMPLPQQTFNAPNIQSPFNCSTPVINTQNPTECPPSQPPRDEASHDKAPDTASQSAAESFWFEDFLPGGTSEASIPPPISAPTNPESAFASMSLNSSTRDRFPVGGIPHVSGMPSEVAQEATGWGDLDTGAAPGTSTGWDASQDIWVNDDGPRTSTKRNPCPGQHMSRPRH